MFNCFYGDYKKTGVNRYPVMTLKELAMVSGKDYSVLRKRMKQTEPPIQVKLTSKGCKYYSKSELLDWVASF